MKKCKWKDNAFCKSGATFSWECQSHFSAPVISYLAFLGYLLHFYLWMNIVGLVWAEKMLFKVGHLKLINWELKDNAFCKLDDADFWECQGDIWASGMSYSCSLGYLQAFSLYLSIVSLVEAKLWLVEVGESRRKKLRKKCQIFKRP